MLAGRILVALCGEMTTNYREMNRIPDFQIDQMFSSTAPAPAPGGEAGTATESTTQPVPLAPQLTGVLEPISGMQSFILTMFGVLAFVMLIAMTRYGRDKNYGD